MNNINRALVKSQAKQIISGKVFMLFVLSAIALILSGGFNLFNTLSVSYNNAYDAFNNYGDYNYDDENSLNDYNDYYDYFNQFSGDGSESGDNPIENFENQSLQSYGNSNVSNEADIQNVNVIKEIAYSIAALINVIFLPLAVTLYGFYVALIKKNPNERFKLSAEIGILFKNTFNGSFFKKLIILILRALFMLLLCILFAIPGIIYNYSTYFAFQLMNDYPNLKPTEALKLSKKITKGNRTELFLLDLSFIPWYLLCIITCGIACIYVIPYCFTVQALYYENFRMRAIAEGRVNENDFLSAEELLRKYNNGANYGGYYDPNSNNQNAWNNSNNQYAWDNSNNQYAWDNSGNRYYNAQQTYYKPASEQKDGYYYNPVQSQTNTRNTRDMNDANTPYE